MSLMFPKPYKGQARDERIASRKAVEAHEDREKTKVRRRDIVCRWPHCDCRARRDRLEVAHIDAKGMGGDHGVRSDAENMLLLCLARHQGHTSLHSGDLRIEKKTVEGANGPLLFYRRGDDGVWSMVGEEVAPGVLARD